MLNMNADKKIGDISILGLDLQYGDVTTKQLEKSFIYIHTK